MIKCVHLKRPLALQLQVDWIQPNVNFFPLGCLQSGSGGWGLYGDGDVIGILLFGSWSCPWKWTDLGLALIHCPPSILPPSSILIQASSSDECQRQTWRGKRKWLVPYNLGHVTEHHISKWWARFSNKFALIINVPVSFNCHNVYFDGITFGKIKILSWNISWWIWSFTLV